MILEVVIIMILRLNSWVKRWFRIIVLVMLVIENLLNNSNWVLFVIWVVIGGIGLFFLILFCLWVCW